jgi:hypothetical protein
MEVEHGRVCADQTNEEGEGWDVSIGGGSQDVIYKVCLDCSRGG